MPYTVDLPDGRSVEFPDEITPERAAQIIRSQFFGGASPITAAPTTARSPVFSGAPALPTTIGGELLEVLKGLPRGATGLLETAAAGAAALLPDQAERELRGEITEFFQPVKEALAPAAGYEESIGARAGEALGSTLPFLAAGPLGAAGRIAATGLGVAAGAGEARLRAEQEGGMEERGTATALGALVGATEVLPIFRILDRLPEKETLKIFDYVKRAAAAGGEELAQEASSNVAQNLIEKGLYNPEQEVLEGAAEEGAYGFGVGAFIQGLTDLALGRRARGAVAAPGGEDELSRIGAEPSVEGAGAGGAELPVSRIGAAGPDLEGLAPAGVGVPSEPTGRVDEGEEVLQPALSFQQRRAAQIDAEEEKQDIADEIDSLQFAKQYLVDNYASKIDTLQAVSDRAKQALENTKLPDSLEAQDLQQEIAQIEKIVNGYNVALSAETYSQVPLIQQGLEPNINWYFTDKGGITPVDYIQQNITVIDPSQPSNVTALEPARFQINEDVARPWYFSALERAAESAKVEKTKPNQWLNVLRQTQGVKQEEIEATGLEDWLKLQGDRTVTKQEIADYVKQNGIQVEELLSRPANFEVFMDGDNTGISFGSREEAQNFIDESARYNVDDAVDMGVVDPEIDNLESLYDTEVARYDIKPPEEIEGGPKYADYQIPGGENYRELLLKLPRKPGEQLYQSHNWDEVRGGPIKNVLAHLRVDDRFSPISGLKNNLFVQEVQSDWGQEARKFGYLPQTKEEKAIDEAQIKKLEEERNNVSAEMRSNREKIRPLQDILRVFDVNEFYIAFTPYNKIEVYDQAADKKLTSEDLEKIKSSEYEYQTYTPVRRRDPERLRKAAELLLDNEQQIADIFKKEKTLDAEYYEKTEEIKAIKGKVPPAPFVGRPGAEGKTESWLNLSLKRALTYAAEEGYDSISFAQGEEVYRAVGGKLEGQKKFYNVILPQTLKKLAPKFGGKLEIVNDRPVIQITPEMRSNLLGGVPLFRMKKEVAQGLPTPEVQKVVSELSSGWANKPNIIVVDTYKDLPKPYRAEKYKNARGMLLGNDVYIVAANAGSASDVKSTLFHESLGHYGLRDLFRTRLNDTLSDIYKTNTAIQNAANEWLRKFPDIYQGSDRTARAVEEILAAKSEKGVIKEPGIRAAFNRLAAMIRKFLRAMGFVKEYSNNDINNILLEAAERVRTQPGPVFNTDASPKFQISQYNRVLTNALEANQRLPEWSQSVGDGVATAMSKMPENLRNAQYYIYSMPQVIELLEKYTPRIKAIDRFIGYRASYTTGLMKTASENHAKYTAVAREYPDKYEEFKNVVNDINLFQVPVREQSVIDLLSQNRASLSPQKQKYYDVAKRFYELPERMQNSILSANGEAGLFADYRKMGDKKFDIFAQVYGGQLGMGVVRDLRERFERERLPMYAPLVRGQGAHWLYYETTDGRSYKEAFANQAAREVAIKKAIDEGLARPDTIERITRPSEVREKGPPPVGFLGEVVSRLEATLPSTMPAAERKLIIDGVYDTFLNFLPSDMLRQELSTRQTFDVDGVRQFGVLGFDQDVLAVYERQMPKIAYQLGNLKFALPIENAMKKATEQAKLYEIAYREGNIPTRLQGRKLMSPKAVFDGIEDMRRRINFAYNPSYAWWVNGLATGNYIYSIAGNVSSALINTTVLAMMTFPSLVARYGVVKSSGMMLRAMKMFAEGGVDEQGNFTFGNAATGEVKTFFDYLTKRGVIGIAAEQELRQAQRAKISGYESALDKLNFALGYVFKNSERFNREVTMLASFMLAREKGKSFKTAAEEAIRLNNNINGTVLPESASRMYQTNLGRVILTFRTFALTQIINLSRAFGQALNAVDATPEDRKIARRQLLGIFGMTYMVAGVKGLPLFSAAEVLAAALMGDDDEPYDLQQEVADSIGLMGLNGPLNAAFDVDIASRTGFNGMLWRDDPKRLADIGFLLYSAERVLGPSYGLIQAQLRGVEKIAAGDIQRGFESMLPAPIRNPLKAARYATDGALTKDGLPIVDDISTWNSVMQVFGFAPAELAATQEQIGAKFAISDKLRSRRTALLTNLYTAMTAGDDQATQEAFEAIDKFNSANPMIGINPRSIQASFRERNRRAIESINGIYLPRNLLATTEEYMADLD